MSYRFFDLPKLPENIIQDCLDAAPDEGNPFYRIDPIQKEMIDKLAGYGEADSWPDDGFTIQKNEIHNYLWSTKDKPVRVSIHPAPDSAVNWINENIFPLIKSEFATIDRAELFMMDRGTRMFPHADFKNFKYNLNFVLLTGGDDVETLFYKPKAEHKGKNIITIVPYKDEVIDVVKSVKTNKYQWCMLERNQIHSVENLTSPRLILQIGVTRL